MCDVKFLLNSNLSLLKQTTYYFFIKEVLQRAENVMQYFLPNLKDLQKLKLKTAVSKILTFVIKKDKLVFMIDSHAHLQDEKFEDVKKILEDANNAGVTKIICASSSLSTSKKAIEIANTYSGVFATVGIHPEEAGDWSQSAKDTLIDLAKNKKVVALGEIGLDYHYEFYPREQQKLAFVEQIKLANELKLPIVVHTREASGDTMQILRENLSLLTNGVVIHCFSMSLEILKEILSYGFYISLGGAITFKNARGLLDIARVVDLDRLMLETDCPYMSPEPFRGQINQPQYVEFVAKKIAELKNISFDEVVKITTLNAEKFFNIKDRI